MPEEKAPPNQRQLASAPGEKLALWEAVVAMAQSFGASWRWMFSEATGSWSFRAYTPGGRFFCALSLEGGRPELSLNLKAEEWEQIHAPAPEEREFLEAAWEKARAGGGDPAWLHVPVESEPRLPAIAKLLMGRSRRIEPRRTKKRR